MKYLLALTITSCAHHTKCLDAAVDYYGDLGAESSSGYEEMTPSEAHFEGVKWAIEYAKGCE